MADFTLQLHSPNEMAKLLSERVRGERLRLNWKQETLAKRSGVSLPTLRRYERTGKTSLENLLRLCHALGHLDEFEKLLVPPPANSIAELKARFQISVPRKRGKH